MRKKIQIKPMHSEIGHAGGLPGFFIAFTASDPHTAQLVCAEITSLFVNENLRTREASAEGTTDFLKEQLQEAKTNLDEQDRRLAEFQQQFAGRLPGDSSANINMLTSLNTQLEAVTQALGRLEQDNSYEETLLAQQTGESISLAGASITSLGGSSKQAMLDDLLQQESALLRRYTPNHPDVLAMTQHRGLAGGDGCG